ncbi:hypothetical protein ACH42_11860 [Endozoicomonas sp. (ex Bugula neritina AB1)]|nr:hypothetical protein ACH42_11860 [Endozoicomonas sp. (ex Bugula neritina AB1)]
MSQLKVALVQLCSGRDIGYNLEAIESLLQATLPDDMDVLVLPECFARMGGSVKELGTDAGRVCYWMTELAQRYGCWLVGGSVPVFDESLEKSYASCFVYDPQGLEVARYDKIHLFDADVADSTGRYRESDDYAAGSGVVTVDIGKAKLGLSICYDLRFPELYRQMVAEGVQILCVPAAFTKATGEVHWEVLLKARAIENQCYVLAANQCGQHSRKRETYGHSMVVSPWGDVIAEAEDKPTIVLAELDLEKLKLVRDQLPCLNHRKIQ